MKTLETLGKIAIVLAFCVGFYFAEVRMFEVQAKVAKCEAAGHTWLYREAKCLEIKEFKVN